MNVLLSIVKSLAASKYGPAILKVLGQRLADLAVRRLGKKAIAQADAIGRLLEQRGEIEVRVKALEGRFGVALPPRVREVVEMLKHQLEELDALLAVARTKLEPKA